MADFLQGAVCDGLVQLGVATRKQVCCKHCQCSVLIWANVCAFVFPETRKEEPVAVVMRGHECSHAAAFSLPGKSDALLYDIAAQAGVIPASQ